MIKKLPDVDLRIVLQPSGVPERTTLALQKFVETSGGYKFWAAQWTEWCDGATNSAIERAQAIAEKTDEPVAVYVLRPGRGLGMEEQLVDVVIPERPPTTLRQIYNLDPDERYRLGILYQAQSNGRAVALVEAAARIDSRNITHSEPHNTRVAEELMNAYIPQPYMYDETGRTLEFVIQTRQFKRVIVRDADTGEAYVVADTESEEVEHDPYADEYE